MAKGEVDGDEALSTEELPVPTEDNSSKIKRRKKEALSSVPLVFGKGATRKRNRNLVVEVPGVEGRLRFGGDVGVIGRVKTTAEGEVVLDVKGSVFKGRILQSVGTLMVATIGSDKARIDAVSDEFLSVEYAANIFDAEKMTRSGVQADGKMEQGDSGDEDYDIDADVNDV